MYDLIDAVVTLNGHTHVVTVAEVLDQSQLTHDSFHHLLESAVSRALSASDDHQAIRLISDLVPVDENEGVIPTPDYIDPNDMPF